MALTDAARRSLDRGDLQAGRMRPWPRSHTQRHRRVASVGFAAALWLASVACGGSTPSVPGGSPSPSPAPFGDAGFLYVLQDNSVVSYAIDATTGQLDGPVTRNLGDVHAISGDPKGRFVFASFGPRSCWDTLTGPSERARLEVYTPDAGGC